MRVPCKVAGCPCKAYAWIPNRPEDIGEFWFQRRRNFDPTKWRAKCKCKHTHDFHDPNTRRCKTAGNEIYKCTFTCLSVIELFRPSRSKGEMWMYFC